MSSFNPNSHRSRHLPVQSNGTRPKIKFLLYFVFNHVYLKLMNMVFPKITALAFKVITANPQTSCVPGLLYVCKLVFRVLMTYLYKKLYAVSIYLATIYISVSSVLHSICFGSHEFHVSEGVLGFQKIKEQTSLFGCQSVCPSDYDAFRVWI